MHRGGGSETSRNGTLNEGHTKNPNLFFLSEWCTCDY